MEYYIRQAITQREAKKPWPSLIFKDILERKAENNAFNKKSQETEVLAIESDSYEMCWRGNFAGEMVILIFNAVQFS